MLIRLQQTEGSRRGDESRADLAAGRTVAAEGGASEVHDRQPRDRRAHGRRRSAATRDLRHDYVAARDHDLHRRPLPLLVRGRRDCGHAARRARDARLPDLLQVRALAERRRRHSHDHRLFGERHHRDLRSRPRKPPFDAARAARAHCQRERQSNARSYGHHRRDDVHVRVVAVHLWRRGASWLCLHDDRRHHQRHLLHCLHRILDRHHSQQQAERTGSAGHDDRRVCRRGAPSRRRRARRRT